MSKETYYFPHDCKARHDRKLVKLIMQHGMSGIGVYWCLVEMLYEEDGFLPLEYERITFELRIDTNVIRSVIHDFELFENDENKFWSNSILDRLQERQIRSEKAKKSVNKRWKPLDNHTNVLQPYNERIADGILIKNNKEKKSKVNIPKIQFLDSVFLTPDETSKLKEKFNGNFDRAVEILNNYKMANGKKYKSDYYVMLGWVTKEVEKISLEKKSSW